MRLGAKAVTKLLELEARQLFWGSGYGRYRKIGVSFFGFLKRIYTGSIKGLGFGTFRKLGVPHFGVLIIRILLFRVPLFSETPV